MIATVAALAGAGLLFLIALVALLWWGQERIIFQPPAPPSDVHHASLRVEYTAADGQPLVAYLVGTPSTARGLLIAFHGNADLAIWQIPWARELSERSGWAVLLAEYRGYGAAPGSPSCANVRLDAEAAHAYARDALGVGGDRLAIFGHSLGSAIATELALSHRPRILILHAPFTSARDMARFVVVRPALLAWRLISRVHYETREAVASLDAPVWVAHGGRDGVVPVSMGRAVFTTARRRGELLIVPEAGHNDVVEAGGEHYWRWAVRALGGDQ